MQWPGPCYGGERTHVVQLIRSRHSGSPHAGLEVVSSERMPVIYRPPRNPAPWPSPSACVLCGEGSVRLCRTRWDHDP